MRYNWGAIIYFVLNRDPWNKILLIYQFTTSIAIHRTPKTTIERDLRLDRRECRIDRHIDFEEIFSRHHNLEHFVKSHVFRRIFIIRIFCFVNNYTPFLPTPDWVGPDYSPEEVEYGSRKANLSAKLSNGQTLAIQNVLEDLHRGDRCRIFEHEELMRRFWSRSCWDALKSSGLRTISGEIKMTHKKK